MGRIIPYTMEKLKTFQTTNNDLTIKNGESQYQYVSLIWDVIEQSSNRFFFSKPWNPVNFRSQPGALHRVPGYQWDTHWYTACLIPGKPIGFHGDLTTINGDLIHGSQCWIMGWFFTIRWGFFCMDTPKKNAMSIANNMSEHHDKPVDLISNRAI